MTDIQPGFTPDAVAQRIFELRGRRVLLDTDLALLYRVETKNLIRAAKRNLDRFPKDFMFQLTRVEWKNVKSQFAIANLEFPNIASNFWRGRLYSPYAFTKHGALMLSSVLNSAWADEISLLIVRSFAWLRQAVPACKEFAAKMAELENARRSLKLYTSLLSRQIINSAILVLNGKK